MDIANEAVLKRQCAHASVAAVSSRLSRMESSVAFDLDDNIDSIC